MPRSSSSRPSSSAAPALGSLATCQSSVSEAGVVDQQGVERAGLLDADVLGPAGVEELVVVARAVADDAAVDPCDPRRGDGVGEGVERRGVEHRVAVELVGRVVVASSAAGRRHRRGRGRPAPLPPRPRPARTSVVNTWSGPSTSRAAAATSSFWLLAGITGRSGLWAPTSTPSSWTTRHDVGSSVPAKALTAAAKLSSLRSRAIRPGTRRNDSSGVSAPAWGRRVGAGRPWSAAAIRRGLVVLPGGEAPEAEQGERREHEDRGEDEQRGRRRGARAHQRVRRLGAGGAWRRATGGRAP